VRVRACAASGRRPPCPPYLLPASVSVSVSVCQRRLPYSYSTRVRFGGAVTHVVRGVRGFVTTRSVQCTVVCCVAHYTRVAHTRTTTHSSALSTQSHCGHHESRDGAVAGRSTYVARSVRTHRHHPPRLRASDVVRGAWCVQTANMCLHTHTLYISRASRSLHDQPPATHQPQPFTAARSTARSPSRRPPSAPPPPPSSPPAPSRAPRSPPAP